LTKVQIEAFGGDPNRIVIFGESAGAISIQNHFLVLDGSGHQEVCWPLHSCSLRPQPGGEAPLLPLATQEGEGESVKVDSMSW
jgi:acetyl esterase/lipase